MRASLLLGLLAGLLLLTALMAHFGLATVGRTLGTMGWSGFLLLALSQLLLEGLMGTAWWLLGAGRPDARYLRFPWARLVRDSAAEALPFSQVGGYVLGARAATVAGVDGGFAAASTVVDVSLELVAQIGYTLLGLALLWRLRPGNSIVIPILIGTLLLGVLAVGFLAAQGRGAAAADRLLARVGAHLLGREMMRDRPLQDAIHAIHARRSAMLLAIATHFAAWVLGGVQCWAMLRLMHLPRPVAAGIIIDSLLYGIRSFAFMVPNAVGVQEAALMLLGGLFALRPEQAFALSLARRGRDLAIGIPALLVWQALEGRRAWRNARLFDPGVETGRVESGEIRPRRDAREDVCLPERSPERRAVACRPGEEH